ncbi:hypothetical protein A2483_04755, partial [Candidatus Peregrinibacteria bacterium RIFOXYC2_FULL_33_13]
TMQHFYKEYTRDEKGTGLLCRDFSWPGAFPSHTTPKTPGMILEGGELGYSLSTAFGAVFDNPDLIAACVIGDGEAETGPLAGSWHSNKFLNPKTSGAVLPILLVNGYKISNPTIFGKMSDQEVIDYFKGLYYEPFIVNDTDPKKQNHQDMIKALENSYQIIKKLQKKARENKKLELKPKWPVIIYRCLKGKSGIKKADGHKIEGHFRSHGIPLGDPKTNKEHFKLVKNWLESYKINELVDKKGTPKKDVLEFVPVKNLCIGMNKHAIGGKLRKELKLPQLSDYSIKIKTPGIEEKRNTEVSSDYVRDIFKLNDKYHNFRFFCPDETESNKFTSLFQATKRTFMWPLDSYDENLSPDGRVMEILSEHTLQGWYQGFVLSGRHGIFATYEAFAPIIGSMVDQHAKFLKYSSHVSWRKPISSMNYILTSIGWRQEHNGFSHQNPSFISSMLEKHGKFCSVYLPPDANSLLVTLEDCLKRTDSINVIAASKQLMPQWISLQKAREQLKTGLLIWDFDDKKANKNPDVVLVSAGDVMVKEIMATIQILKCYAPELKIRHVNVSELTALGVGDERHPLTCNNCRDFDKYFTEDKPVIVSFHGYPGVIAKLISGHHNSERFRIHGYLEEGTTTTPFDMLVLNQCSRFHLAIEALKAGLISNPKVAEKAKILIKKLENKISLHTKYIRKYGKDMDDIENWNFKNPLACKL